MALASPRATVESDAHISAAKSTDIPAALSPPTQALCIVGEVGVYAHCVLERCRDGTGVQRPRCTTRSAVRRAVTSTVSARSTARYSLPRLS